MLLLLLQYSTSLQLEGMLVIVRNLTLYNTSGVPLMLCRCGVGVPGEKGPHQNPKK